MFSYDSFVRNKPLAELSTFRIGGPCDYFIEIHRVDELAALFAFCQKELLPYFVLGKGSNSLFHDAGFRGLVILNKIDFLEEEGETFRVGAGYSFSLLGTQTARSGYAGLEFASGIPGSVGGAVFMNAGANGRETCESLQVVEYLRETGELVKFSKEELTFSYRTSPFQKMRGAITAATFKLSLHADARKKQLHIISYRKGTQPLSEPSVGCIFRNPEGDFSAGALIERAGLKGAQEGGIKVSEVHANFMVNASCGKSEEVVRLIKRVKSEVKEKYGVELHEEVRVIPDAPR